MKMICTVETCDTKARAKGLCNFHYGRKSRGTPLLAQKWFHWPGHGLSQTPEYRNWISMKERCLNSNHPYYKNYGGRGITICDRWLNEDGIKNFYADMGKRPTLKHTLDRIDNDKGYSPENCQWATRGEQALNMSTSKLELDVPKETRIKQLLDGGVSKEAIEYAMNVKL